MNKKAGLLALLAVGFILAVFSMPGKNQPCIWLKLYSRIYGQQYFAKSEYPINRIFYQRKLGGKISRLQIKNDKKFNWPFDLKNGEDICINMCSPEMGCVFSSVRQFIDNTNGRVDQVFPRWKFSFDGAIFENLGKHYEAQRISYPGEKVEYCVWVKVKKI